jgi:hypothetical protein
MIAQGCPDALGLHWGRPRGAAPTLGVALGRSALRLHCGRPRGPPQHWASRWGCIVGANKSACGIIHEL